MKRCGSVHVVCRSNKVRRGNWGPIRRAGPIVCYSIDIIRELSMATASFNKRLASERVRPRPVEDVEQ